MKKYQANRVHGIRNVDSDMSNKSRHGDSITGLDKSREHSLDRSLRGLLTHFIITCLVFSASLSASVRSDGSPPFTSGESHHISCVVGDTLRLNIPLKKYFMTELWPNNSKCGKFLKNSYDVRSSRFAEQIQIGVSDGSNIEFGGDEKIILSGVLEIDSGSISLMFISKGDTVQQQIQIRSTRLANKKIEPSSSKSQIFIKTSSETCNNDEEIWKPSAELIDSVVELAKLKHQSQMRASSEYSSMYSNRAPVFWKVVPIKVLGRKSIQVILVDSSWAVRPEFTRMECIQASQMLIPKWIFDINK